MKTNEQIAEQLVKECGITAPYDSLKKLVVDALEMKDGNAEIDSQTTSVRLARELMGDKFVFTRKDIYNIVSKTIGWCDERFAEEITQSERDWREKYELLECRLKDTEERDRIGTKIIKDLRTKNNELEQMYRQLLSELTIDCRKKAESFIKQNKLSDYDKK